MHWIDYISAQSPHPWVRPSPGGWLQLTCKSPSVTSKHLRQSIFKNTPRLMLIPTMYPWSSSYKCKVISIQDTTRLVLVMHSTCPNIERPNGVNSGAEFNAAPKRWFGWVRVGWGKKAPYFFYWVGPFLIS